MILLSLFLSAAFAHEHHHPDPKLRDSVDRAVSAVEKPIEVKPEFCPATDDRAFINFSPEHLKDDPSFHGMLFFGTDTFYISHLPMFHHPHDYQAIVEVKLPESAKAKYLASAKKNGGYFTFAPDDTFVLPKTMTNIGGKIPGKLVQGHFERGGNNLVDVELEVVRVVLYKKLSSKEKKPAKEKYAVFGNGKEFFTAHVVSSRPGVDEILPVPADVLSAADADDVKKNGLILTDDTEIKDGSVTVTKTSKKFPYKEFYRETGDLE